MSKSSEDIDIDLQISKALQATSTLLNGLMEEVRENTKETTSLRAELQSLTDIVRTLSRIIRDGNGGASLMTRIAVMEKMVEIIEKDTSKKEGQAQVKEGRRWEMVVALVAAGIAVAVSIFTALPG